MSLEFWLVTDPRNQKPEGPTSRAQVQRGLSGCPGRLVCGWRRRRCVVPTKAWARRISNGRRRCDVFRTLKPILRGLELIDRQGSGSEVVDEMEAIGEHGLHHEAHLLIALVTIQCAEARELILIQLGLHIKARIQNPGWSIHKLLLVSQTESVGDQVSDGGALCAIHIWSDAPMRLLLRAIRRTDAHYGVTRQFRRGMQKLGGRGCNSGEQERE